MSLHLGTLRHGIKHRTKARALRDRFPRMVTRLLRIRPHPDMRIGEKADLVRLPKGAFVVERWAAPTGRYMELLVRHPAHLPIIINPRFVEEIRR